MNNLFLIAEQLTLITLISRLCFCLQPRTGQVVEDGWVDVWLDWFCLICRAAPYRMADKNEQFSCSFRQPLC